MYISSCYAKILGETNFQLGGDKIRLKNIEKEVFLSSGGTSTVDLGCVCVYLFICPVLPL